MKRPVRLMLALALALALVLPASALTPSYPIDGAYLHSPYYTALAECTLIEDMRHNVLTVAFTQIGYHEGNSEADMDGRNALGVRNFVEYNRIYGKLDNGEDNGNSYGYAWCAAFVSWCLRQAGVPTTVAITEVSCNRMTDWYRSANAFHPRAEGYTPRPGDIIMFHRGNGVAGHAGLVVGVKDGDVYTIEGNRYGMVGQHKYQLNNRTILGYCAPQYNDIAGTDYDFPLSATTSGRIAVIAVGLAVILAAGAVLVIGGRRIRRRKLAELDAAMAEDAP